MKNSPTNHFVLSALVVHETHWRQLLDAVIALRREFRSAYELKLREEIHAAEWFSKPGEMARIPKHIRLHMCKKVIDFVEQLDYVRIINVVVEKDGKPQDYDIFTAAWQHLIQRIDNTLWYGNFPNGFVRKNECAMLLPDRTDDKKLKTLIRRMRRHNYVPYIGGKSARPLNMRYIVEDAYMKESADSYISQLVDVISYFLYQKLSPNSYMRKKKGYNFFMRLDKVLFKEASTKCKWGKGVVWI